MKTQWLNTHRRYSREVEKHGERADVNGDNVATEEVKLDTLNMEKEFSQ